MAGEIGVDAADGDRIGFFPGGTGGSEQRRADLRETLGLNDRHGGSSWFLPAWVLLVFVGAHGLKAMVQEQVPISRRRLFRIAPDFVMQNWRSVSPFSSR